MSALELEISQIKERLERPHSDPDWLEKMKGSMKGMRGFPAVVELGQQLRESEPYSDEHEAEV